MTNGYTTATSDWIRRQAYHATHDNREKRKANQMNVWTRDEMDVKYAADDLRRVTSHRGPQCNIDAETHGYE